MSKVKDDWRALWCHPDTFATTLLAMFVDAYGTEGVSWDPATIVLQIEDDWNIPLPRVNHDKLMVAIQLLTTERFYKSCPDFVDFCNVLNGDYFDPRMWNPADAAEIAWAITEALLIDPPDSEDEEPFTDEIRGYIGAALDAEGIMNPPDILRIALRGGPPPLNIQDEFSDDPEMFGAIYQVEAAKTADINALVKQNLRLLSQQLEGLQLSTGNPKNVVEMFRRVAG